MAEVWKALDLNSDRGGGEPCRCAIKFPSRNIRLRKLAEQALVREFALSRRLIHPNLVPVHALNTDEDPMYLVMDFCPGLPLNQFIRRHPEGISPETAKPIIEAMCEALAFCHERGVLHLDFKPGNVLYDAESGMTKVLDFGAARAIVAPVTAASQSVEAPPELATNAYASPEMLAGDAPATSDDVFALGCVAYELLSGSHPFARRDALSAARSGLRPASVAGLNRTRFAALERGLVLARKHRTRSVQELYRGLFPGFAVRAARRYRKRRASAFVLFGAGLSALFYPGIASGRMEEMTARLSNWVSEWMMLATFH